MFTRLGCNTLNPTAKLRLQELRCGAALCQLCQLEAFARSPEEWRRRAADNERTAAQYQKLFGSAAESQNQKKRERKKRKQQQQQSTGTAQGSDYAHAHLKGSGANVVDVVMAELEQSTEQHGDSADVAEKKSRKKHRKHLSDHGTPAPQGSAALQNDATNAHQSTDGRAHSGDDHLHKVAQETPGQSSEDMKAKRRKREQSSDKSAQLSRKEKGIKSREG